MGAHSAMAPYTKMLQAGKKRHEEEDSNDLLDTDAIGSVETSPPDMDDVLSSVYGKIRGFRRNKDLEDEHKVAASKSAVVKGAAQLDMGVGAFRNLLDEYVEGRSEGLGVRDTLSEAFDKTLAPVELKAKKRQKVQLHNGPKKVNNAPLPELRMDNIFSIGGRRIKRTNSEGSFVVLNFRKYSTDKTGAKLAKYIDHNIYENLIKTLLEAVLMMISSRTVTPATVGPISKLDTFQPDDNGKDGVELPTVGYDLSNLCKTMYDNTLSYDLNDEVEVFMRVIYNRWHMTIRKHKLVTQNKEKPHFDFDLPAELMENLVVCLRTYMKLRELGADISPAKLQTYERECPSIAPLMEEKIAMYTTKKESTSPPSGSESEASESETEYDCVKRGKCDKRSARKRHYSGSDSDAAAEEGLSGGKLSKNKKRRILD